MTNYTIAATATVYDFDSRDEVSIDQVNEFIRSNDAIVELSSWKSEDVDWPESDREGRKVFVITPTNEGLRDELSQWVLVVE